MMGTLEVRSVGMVVGTIVVLRVGGVISFSISSGGNSMLVVGTAVGTVVVLLVSASLSTL